MASPFDDWNLEDARIAVQLSAEDAARIESCRKFVEGDHWQNWAGWIGPTPLESDKDAATVRAEIERGFVARNAVGECVGRHVNGVLGRNVKWSIVPRRKLGPKGSPDEKPSADEQTLIDEAKELLDLWIEIRKLDQEYDKLGKALLTAGIAYQRPFVAPGELNEEGIVPTADLQTSLGRVYVDFPLPGTAVIWKDPATQRECSIYLYREVVSHRPSQIAGTQGDERAELTYLDGDQTIIRILGAPSGGADLGAQETGDGAQRAPQIRAAPGPALVSPDFSYSLGGRLLMADMQRAPLVTMPVLSQQKLLNLSLTMKERNVILGGFLERVAINAQMNGSYETGADGVRRFVVADPLPVGAGAMTTLTGYVLRDRDGNETLASPNMLWREPVDVTTFITTEDSAYQAILAECNQLHYAMAGDAGASGISRETAAAAYLVDLLQSKQQLDAGWSWLLETALSLASTLSGMPGHFDKVRVSAECSVDPGPISVESMRAAMELTGGQPLLSTKTARGWIGVEDADAEETQIEAESAKLAETQGPDLKAVQELLNNMRGGGGGGENGNGNGAGGSPVGAVNGQAAAGAA